MRLFIAFEIDETIRRSLRGISANIGGRPSRIENLHLKLRFIGEQPSYRDAQYAMSAIADMPPVKVRVRRLGHFGDLRDAHVYAAAESTPPLSEYADTLSAELTKRGVPFDSKKFKPHITLARRADLTQTPLPEIDEMNFELHRATLFESRRIRGVLTYIPLYSIELKERR